MNTTERTLAAFHAVSMTRNSVPVLKNVSFSLKSGEVHAVTGAPGAGKSTIVAILSGETTRFGGEIEVHGVRYRTFSPAQALALGIATVRQRMAAVPSLTVSETLFASHLPTGAFFKIRERELRERSRALLGPYGAEIDPRSRMRELTYDQRCIVALAAAVSQHPSILILDEVTSTFSSTLLDLVHDSVAETVSRGGAVLFVTSRPKDVFDIADRVTFVHDGQVTSTRRTTDVDKIKLVDLTYSLATSRQELRESNLELQRYKQFNEDIIRSLPIGVVILETNRSPYIVNGEAARILGYDEQRVLSFEWVLAQLEPSVREELRHAVTEGITKDWTDVPHNNDTALDIRVLPFTGHKYENLGTILLFTDVTYNVQMRSFMLQAEKTKSIALLAAGIAHEINNPLAIILNHADIMKRHSQHGSDGDRRLGVIDQELHRIRSTIQSLLSFSHTDEGALKPLDLRSVVVEAYRLIEHRVADDEARIETKIPDRDVQVLGNENQLIQLLINLVSNALDACCPPNADITVPRVRVQLEPDDGSGYVALHVLDNGPGITTEREQLVFDPFFSTKPETVHAGLGLALCRNIAATHRGSLHYQRVGDLTDFVLVVPALDP